MLSCQRSGPGLPRKDALRRHYLLFGMGAAVLVAAAIVAVGAVSGDGAAVSGAAASQSLPPGHPSTGANGEPSSGASSSGKVDKTIDQLQKASAADPHNATLLMSLGDAYVLGGRYRQAERAYRSALASRPGDATATVRLAMVWHAEGQTTRATTSLGAVLAKDPGQQEAHYSLAIIKFSQNDIAGAKSEWAAAARIDPKSTIGRRSQNFVDLLEGKQSAEPEPGSSN
jgi:cytochrome c-type biogenesis protein CcmH/NrfG